MQPIATPHLQSILLACAIAVAFPAVAEDATTTSNTSTTGTTTTSSTTTATSAIGSSATTEAKLAAEFADFLGGETQAKSVVSSLRQGTYNADAESSTAPATTTSSTSTTGTTGSTTGTTTGNTGTTATATSGSTGTMGYGEVRMTLRLAQAQLDQMGITQPTDAELAAVLQGGEVGGTQVDGILALRADGMGWGQIAQKSGMTVGQLMGKAPAKTATVTTSASASKAGKPSATTTTRSASAPQARANGYIPSSPKAGSTQARSNGYIPSGKSNGAGIVSGAGDRMTAAAGVNRGQTHKAGANVQSGGGSVSAGGRLVSMGGGSRAGASVDNPGHARKN
ncbi:hypothetical protein Tbd_1947 [Thiobacillus denitrificans ATCC 25259]|uniref:Uncharacterized protein n=1 Tax=Thiobacillus denitrificans (strain ATCC 25259 / T1) TaxID=292415 RepID=Q3SHI6_THIDA|nr:hypothetical protein [Thiobacillus denitrificans]AAZ97900.1 hypothetical protein Tbd_1947 [Thiobacillus denitrificans ATCC 25259]